MIDTTYSTYYIMGVLGFFGLAYGGNVLVKGTVQTANSLNIPAHLIAITIVALGTSAPELFVSVVAVIEGSPDIAWGNVVGSNIANLLLVIGGASLFITLTDNSKSLRLDIFWMAFSTILIYLCGYFFDGISNIVGLFLIIFLIFILIFMALNSEKNHEKPNSEIKKEYNNFSPLIKGLFFTFGGIITVLIASAMLVYSANKISISFGIEESLIGVTIVALGTSLPEISASVAAARKGYPDIAIGNVLGSNLFNSLGILGASSIASHPLILQTPQAFINYDLPIMLFCTIILGSCLFYFKKINRVFGPILIFIYMIYIINNFL